MVSVVREDETGATTVERTMMRDGPRMDDDGRR
jgi:hypothetical protein